MSVECSDYEQQWMETFLRSISPENDVELRFNLLQLIDGNGFEYVVKREGLIREQALFALTL